MLCYNREYIYSCRFGIRCRMQINERAEFRCSYHRDKSSNYAWKFDCRRDSENSFLDFHYPNQDNLLAGMSALKSNETEDYDDDWFKYLYLTCLLRDQLINLIYIIDLVINVHQSNLQKFL